MMFENPYDLLATSYQEIVMERAGYLQGVNNYIINAISSAPQSILDIGCADGQRSNYLFNKLKARQITLLDSSAEMIKICESNYEHKTMLKSISELAASDGTFSYVFMLWNVFGHTKNHQERIDSLHAISHVMNSKSKLIFDVNNLLNAKRYGLINSLSNYVLDAIKINPERGDRKIQWSVNGLTIPATGHLFTPREIKSLLKETGFKIEELIYISYDTGKKQKFSMQGQILVKCSLNK